MISNWRSTAERNRGSAVYFSMVLFWVNCVISTASWRMSSRSFLDSSRIEQFSLLVDGLKEIRVFDGLGDDQVNGTLEEFLQLF